LATGAVTLTPRFGAPLNLNMTRDTLFNSQAAASVAYYIHVPITHSATVAIPGEHQRDEVFPNI
jgi:hypothetical protein